MSEDSLKIMAVSLLSQQRFYATAAFTSDQLVIAEVTPIPGMFNSWREKLTDMVQDRVNKGFVVIVEERTDLIARYGTQYLLEDVGDENRTNMQEALDWYFALEAMSNIIFTEETKRYQISSGGEGAKIDKDQDDKGRPVYKVDWARLSGGFRVVLLCVVAAMQEPISERFLGAVWPGVDQAAEDLLNPAQRFNNALEAMNRKKGADLMRARG